MPPFQSLLKILCFFLAGLFLPRAFAQPAQALDSLHRAVETSEGQEKVKALNFLLNAYVHSDPAKARVYGEEALALAREIDYEYGISASLNNMGITYEYEANYEAALDLYLQSLKLDEARKETASIANTLNNIGIIYHQLGQFGKTTHYWKRALKLREETGDSAAVAQSLHNLATVYQLREQYDSARTDYTKALHIFRAHGHAQGMASCYTNLGVIHQKLGELEQAHTLLTKALNIQDSIGDVISKLATLGNIGSLLVDMGQPEGALSCFRQVLREARGINNKTEVRNALFNISEMMFKTGRPDSAYHYLLKHIALKDSLMNEERSKQVAELETRYETEKKERQIKTQALELEQANAKNLLLLGLFVIVIMAGVFTWLTQRQKRKAGRELDKMKSRFFANLVHEFRTPITLIKGPIEEAMQGVNDTGTRARLEMAARNTERLGTLINQVLDVSRLESGRMPVTESYGDLVLQMANTVDYFSGRAAAKRITLAFHSNAESFTTMFDADKVEKIVSNLVGNALKFTDNGGQVQVSLHVSENDPPAAEIEVTDSGIGIPESERSRIFDRFYQVNSHDYHEGTGIGLALVKEFTELLHGTVEVSGKPGEGSTFKVVLPMKKWSRAEAATPTASVEETALAPEHAGELIEVLLVEDNADMREYLRSVLDESRFLVHESSSGEEGLERARDLVPDVVILDVMMPGMDGLEVCRQLKHQEVTDHIPVIMLTAKSSGDSRLAGMEHGADAYIGKPFRKRELLVQLDNLLNLRNNIREKYGQPVTSSKPKGILQSENAFVKKVITTVEKHLDNEHFSIDQLAGELYMSRTQLHRKLKAISGMPASMLVRNIRLEKAKALLQRHEGNVTEVAYKVGFGSQPYFSKCFHEYFGMTPREAMNTQLESQTL